MADDPDPGGLEGRDRRPGAAHRQVHVLDQQEERVAGVDVAEPAGVGRRVAPVGAAVAVPPLPGQEGHPEGARGRGQPRHLVQRHPIDPDRAAGRGPPAGPGQETVDERSGDVVAAHRGQPGRRDPVDPPPDPGQPAGDGRGRVGVVAETDRPRDRGLVGVGSLERLPRGPEGVGDVAAARSPAPGEEVGRARPPAGCRRPARRAPRGRRRARRRAPRASARQPRREQDVEGAGDAGQRRAVGHARGGDRPVDQGRVVQAATGERHRQDPHERSVAEPVGQDAPRLLGGDARVERVDGRPGGVPDVEAPVAVGRVGALVEPAPDPPALVGRVEPDAGASTVAVRGHERIEQGEHEGAVVAPRAGGLAVGASSPEDDLADRLRRAELVGHAQGVAHEMAPDRALEAFGLLFTLRRPVHPRNVAGRDRARGVGS